MNRRNVSIDVSACGYAGRAEQKRSKPMLKPTSYIS
jgi:hypothetical protein